MDIRVRRSAAALLLAVMGAACAWLMPFDSPDVIGGLPRADSFWVRLTTHTLQNPGFVVGYSEWRRNPLWVAFRAGRPPEDAPALPRPEHFGVDRRTLIGVSAEDYRGSRYDRGHLAPNYLISRLYGDEAQQATFLMSNIAPQTQRLNQLLWQRLEEAEADVVAPRVGELWVVTGPVFGEHRALRSGVEVPTHFFRIWFDARARSMLAFVMPQEVCGDEPLERFVVSVDEVERLTGLDFFAALDDTEETALESTADAARWQVQDYSHAPARYASRFKGKCRLE